MMRSCLGQASSHPVQRPITTKEERLYSLSMNRFRQLMLIGGQWMMIQVAMTGLTMSPLMRLPTLI